MNLSLKWLKYLQTLVASKVNDDYGDTVPSKPQNVGQVANVGPTSNTLSKQQVSDGMELGAEGMYVFDLSYFLCPTLMNEFRYLDLL